MWIFILQKDLINFLLSHQLQWPTWSELASRETISRHVIPAICHVTSSVQWLVSAVNCANCFKNLLSPLIALIWASRDVTWNLNCLNMNITWPWRVLLIVVGLKACSVWLLGQVNVKLVDLSLCCEFFTLLYDITCTFLLDKFCLTMPDLACSLACLHVSRLRPCGLFIICCRPYFTFFQLFSWIFSRIFSSWACKTHRLSPIERLD